MSRYWGNPCAQCGAIIIAAEWSEYLTDQCVRNVWSCDDCGYHFENMVDFNAAKAQQILEPA
jgi:ribosomal protein L37AE/L43A